MRNLFAADAAATTTQAMTTRMTADAMEQRALRQLFDEFYNILVFVQSTLCTHSARSFRTLTTQTRANDESATRTVICNECNKVVEM